MNFPLEPNRDLIMPHGWDMGFLIFAGSVMSLFVLYGLWLLAAKREPLLLMVLIGGMLGEMLEPICNVLGMAYHPEHGQMVGFVTLGRHIPLWLVLCYPSVLRRFRLSHHLPGMRAVKLTATRFWATLGVASVLLLRHRDRPGARRAVGLLRRAAAEAFFAKPGATHGMPPMWYIVNPTSVVATAAFLALAMRNLKGWQRWPVLALMPMSIVGFHTGAFFAPVYVTENAGWSASQSLLTAGISTLFCVVLLKTFERMPFATRSVEVARQGATVKSGPEMVRGGKPA